MKMITSAIVTSTPWLLLPQLGYLRRIVHDYSEGCFTAISCLLRKTFIWSVISS